MEVHFHSPQWRLKQHQPDT